MSTKCTYVKYMYEKCKREGAACHINKKLLDECKSQNLYFSGPHYKLKHMWLNDTHKSRGTTHKDRRENT